MNNEHIVEVITNPDTGKSVVRFGREILTRKQRIELMINAINVLDSAIQHTGREFRLEGKGDNDVD